MYLKEEYEDLDTALARIIPDVIEEWVSRFPNGLNSHPTYWKEPSDDEEGIYLSWEGQLKRIAKDIRAYNDDHPDDYASGEELFRHEEEVKSRAVHALTWLSVHFMELWD